MCIDQLTCYVNARQLTYCHHYFFISLAVCARLLICGGYVPLKTRANLDNRTVSSSRGQNFGPDIRTQLKFEYLPGDKIQSKWTLKLSIIKQGWDIQCKVRLFVKIYRDEFQVMQSNSRWRRQCVCPGVCAFKVFWDDRFCCGSYLFTILMEKPSRD